MGTEVEPKMYMPGYYTIRDLDDNAGNGSWTVHRESRTSKNGQYYDIFLTRPPLDGYLGHDKEQLRQTILKHESIFKHQLHELHRVYKRQRDLMNEIKCRELREHPIPAGASLSSLFSSRISSEDAKNTWHFPNFPSVDTTCGRPSMSGTDSIQSSLSLIKGKIMQSGSVPHQNGVPSKDCNSFESRCKKLQRRLFGHELPADKYTDNEEERLEERVSGVSSVEGYPPNMNYEVARKREVNLFRSSGTNSGCNGNASPSGLDLRNHRLADLNEPIQVEDASPSASCDILGHVTDSEEKIRKQDAFVNSNSTFQCLGKESSQNSPKGRDGEVCLNNLHIENERSPKGWLTCNSKAEQSRGSKDSFHGGFRPEDSPTPFKPSQVESRKDHEPLTLLPSDPGKTEPRTKRTIFGVEFSERNHDLSAVASHAPGLQPLVPQSFQASSISCRNKLPNDSSHDLVSVQEHRCINDFSPSNKSSKTLIQSPELVGERLLANSNSRCIPRLSVEVSYQNGLCLGSQTESAKLRDCCPSSGFDYLISITDNNPTSEQFEQYGPLKYRKVSGCMDVKSAKDMNVDVVPPDQVQNQLISQQNPVSANGQRKHEKPQGDFPWLMSSKGKESSYKMKLDSAQNCSQLFANKTEMGKGPSQGFILDSISSSCVHDTEQKKKIEVGDSPSIRKILGVPIFDKPLNSKDLSYLSCSSNPSCLTSSIDNNTGKLGFLNSDLVCDPLSLKPVEQLKVEGLVVEKGLDNCSSGFRHQIDLNLCLFEEEIPSRPSSPTAIVKIAAEINLEAPIVLEIENGSPGFESLEIQFKKPSESLREKSGEPCERLVRVAAEAIIAISSSWARHLLDDATYCPSEAPQSDSLLWFADVISSYKCDLENEIGAFSTGKDAACHEEFLPNEIDYFEFMTLKLTETKLEEYYCKPQALENQKEEDTLPRRPRRGQARRGRQRKDFQRDILPGLASLSRHEVTEDIQAFEGLIRASGGSWESSLTKRNAAKNGSGRGRRRSGGSAPTPTVTVTVTAVCPPLPVQQANCRELGLEERSLTGWGKRTRRPPRQRCPLGSNPPLLLK